MNLGFYQILTASRPSEFGYWLSDSNSEILLPNKEVPTDLYVGKKLEVFIYRDSEDRLTATLLKPHICLDECGQLTVCDVSATGVWLDWGLDKHLLLPKSEQMLPLQVGDTVIVKLLLDVKTDRLFATTKIARQLRLDLTQFKVGQQVNILIWKPHVKGWTVIVENHWQGMVFFPEAQNLAYGKKISAFIMSLREDGKMDLSLAPPGFEAGNVWAVERILRQLTQTGCQISLNDNSSPQEIRNLLGLSKKAFKKACGSLLKERKIHFQDGSIHLTKDLSENRTT